MKRCPKCDFSFVNFHHVCDFDGTDLIDDPDTLPVSPAVSALAAATQSPFLRLLKSPVFLMVVALAGLVSSALVFGYYDAANQANSIAESPARRNSANAQDSFGSQVPPTQPADRITTRAPSINPNEVRTGSGDDPARSRSEISKPRAKDLASTRERSVKAPHPRPRVRSSPAIRSQPSGSELALQRQPKDKPLQKDSKQSEPQKVSKENLNRKESKLSAALKSTWSILKKPFKF